MRSFSAIYKRNIASSFLRTHTRCGSSHVGVHALPQDLTFIPDFFSVSEQRILLTTALQKLNAAERRHFRQRRKQFCAKLKPTAASDSQETLHGIFLPDEYYDFQEGHYDGVIRRFREMHVSTWPSDFAGLSSIIERLQTLYPSHDTQTHILHLASDGEILPHIDNVGASGSWILGVSLGATRLLKLESLNDPNMQSELPLTSGSVYIQKDTLRYEYKHSILQNVFSSGGDGDLAQRLSVIVRDRLPSPTA
ncbi:hypothetical protein WOLCODRAFT_136066 [Wolfiporia cocos MD-104 SS10]|uniref:Alpha-ketoglutarate-dependent dioxygenase AlkB-like domain-containing protein n=1 Tax=Wolfiporia cocos (strain MD-104) TaxID=742152 RepID=A0A2H3JNC7_WOLCO|nr:hypothetical protein WOLCODRAFT_136066 [Wolfiporia cocos MD-104 SS10]